MAVPEFIASARRILLRLAVGARPRVTAIRAIVLAVVCVVFFRWFLRPVRADGISMEPTVRTGSLHFAWLPAYRFRAPRAGDIVVVRMAGREVMYLKRVLAVPGETIEFENDRLRVDGAPRPEPYIRPGGEWTMAPYRLGPGEYFVAGDNRSVPRERHVAGVTDRSRIAGRMVF